MIRRLFAALALIGPFVVLGLAAVSHHWLWLMVLLVPAIIMGIQDMRQEGHAIRRNFPVLGRMRYLLEEIRPEIQQYFIESDTGGRPFSREQRSVVYRRAKGARDTLPFGTLEDVGTVGYEWMAHSMAPVGAPQEEPRLRVGGPHCKQPYESSRLNISAMSYGALSRNAILALSAGASKGGFAHNTGEGGISPYHLEGGADLIWQIGTGYFGCRTDDGNFDPEKFRHKSATPAVKMIELKLSQGAKPGHGGILPAAKLTPEIAEIRGVPMGRDVLSPPAHRAFVGPDGLVQFLGKMRELSGGKPVGFKLCVGYKDEFLAVCRAMVKSGIYPDFISVDGSEGGTGAAPMEFSDNVGVPLREGLSFVHNALRGFGIRNEIRVIAAGKVATGFDMVSLMALGADGCNAARSMMLALGCIQARACNTNHCPAGVATQDPGKYKGLVVSDKSARVARYHHATIHSFLELLGAAGLPYPDLLRPDHVFRRVSPTEAASFEELFPSIDEGCLLQEGTVPDSWRKDWRLAALNSPGQLLDEEGSRPEPMPV